MRERLENDSSMSARLSPSFGVKVYGAGRRRLAWQLLTESAVLAVAGAVPGLLVAWLGVRALVATLPADMPRLDAIAIDGHVLVAALGLSLATGLLFGVVPALRAARGDLEETLRGGGRDSSAARPRALGFFVVIEVALALVLLAGAGHGSECGCSSGHHEDDRRSQDEIGREHGSGLRVRRQGEPPQ